MIQTLIYLQYLSAFLLFSGTSFLLNKTFMKSGTGVANLIDDLDIGILESTGHLPIAMLIGLLIAMPHLYNAHALEERKPFAVGQASLFNIVLACVFPIGTIMAVVTFFVIAATRKEIKPKPIQKHVIKEKERNNERVGSKASTRASDLNPHSKSPELNLDYDAIFQAYRYRECMDKCKKFLSMDFSKDSEYGLDG